MAVSVSDVLLRRNKCFVPFSFLTEYARQHTSVTLNESMTLFSKTVVMQVDSTGTSLLMTTYGLESKTCTETIPKRRHHVPTLPPLAQTSSHRRTSRAPLLNHLPHKVRQQRTDLVRHDLVPSGVGVHPVAQHIQREAIFFGAVGDDDGGLSGVVALDPAGNLGV